MNIFVNPDENRPRAGWRLLLQAILMIFFVGTAVFLIQFIWQGSGRLVNVLPTFVGTVISIWIAAKMLDKRPVNQYGLKFNNKWLREFTAGSLIGITVIGIVFLLEWMLNWVEVTGWGWERTSNSPFILLIGGYLGAMLLVAFYEELFSRGYQLLNLTEGLSMKPFGYRGAVTLAVILTSSLFGILHANNPNAGIISVFNIFLAGIVLAIPYLLTGSLAISTGLHFSWNFALGGIFGFPVSGLNFRTSIIQIEQHGSEIWTGGAFGPEAGIVGVMGMAVMVVFSLVYINTGYPLTIHKKFKHETGRSHNADEQGL